MARGTKTETRAGKAVRVDPLLVARCIVDLKNLEVGYVCKEVAAVEASRKSRNRNRLFIDGDSSIFTAHDLRTAEEDGGVMEEHETYRDYLRVICIKEKVRKQKVKTYTVDASHLELGPESVFDRRIPTREWEDYPFAAPLPVLRLIGNSLDLAHFEQEFEAAHGVPLPPNELSIMRQESI